MCLPCSKCWSSSVVWDGDGLRLTCSFCGFIGPETDEEKTPVELWDDLWVAK